MKRSESGIAVAVAAGVGVGVDVGALHMDRDGHIVRKCDEYC